MFGDFYKLGALIGVFIVYTAFAPSLALSLSEMTEDELSTISAREGLALDLNLDLSIDEIIYTDADGAGTGNSGIIQLGSGTAGVTFDNNGSAANLTGLTINADGNVNIGGSSGGGLVVGMPNNTFDLTIDEMYLGSATNNTFEMQVNGIDASNTTLEVGAN